MKIFFLILLALTVQVHGQSRLVKIEMASQFVPVSTNYTNSVRVEEWEVASVLSLYFVGGEYGPNPGEREFQPDLQVNFPRLRREVSFLEFQKLAGHRIAGLADLRISGTGPRPGIVTAIILIETLSADPRAYDPQRVYALPKGVKGTIALEESTDLKTWKNIGGQTLPASTENKFFRGRFDVFTDSPLR